MEATTGRKEYTKEELVDLFLSFIRKKGIDAEEAGVTGENFFQGIVIRKGRLIVDREKLHYPGDLLHEAGHIAVVPAEERPFLSGNVTVERPGTEGEEMSVMLWTYAACIELNIPAEIVFHEHGYRGQGQWIVEQYRSGNYIGLPLLQWMGLTGKPGEEGGFPEMIKWIRS